MWIGKRPKSAIVNTKLIGPVTYSLTQRHDFLSFLFSSEIPYGRPLHQAILATVPTDSPQVQRAVEIITLACAQQNGRMNNNGSNQFVLGDKNIDSNHDSSSSNSFSKPSEDSSNNNRNQLMVHPLQRLTGEECRCEIKVSRHAQHALIAVIRDVTERYRRFEAEQRAHTETVQRQRDAQAVNRFTRHEVKNGLLAGIELCDSLRNTFEGMEQNLLERKRGRMEVEAAALADTERSRSIIGEMDKMLHEVLDTVLAEAMARDVIHEVYRPRLERLDVKGLLSSCNYGLGTLERFPLKPIGDVPYLLMDPQLLRYIHRNAFSNACKYGKPNGVVLTTVEFDQTSNMFEMKVINEPGRCHDDCKLNVHVGWIIKLPRLNFSPHLSFFVDSGGYGVNGK